MKFLLFCSQNVYVFWYLYSKFLTFDRLNTNWKTVQFEHLSPLYLLSLEYFAVSESVLPILLKYKLMKRF